MDKVFKLYKNLLTNRCEKIPLLDIGEDSIRYDFFIALSKIKRLKPHEILLEYPINKNSFIPRNNKKSKRKEKPQMDLVVENNELKICVEFGLFRQNSNEEGTINKTARTVKMLNDIIRLGIDSYYTKRRAFFICVADDKMLGHQLQSKLLGPFPSDYQINKEIIEKQKQKRTSKFDDRFTNKLIEMNLNISSNLIFNNEIKANKINRETRILVWEIKS